MRHFLICFSAMLLLAACSDPSGTDVKKEEKEAIKKQQFFPVTDYIKGQVYEIKTAGINPLKYTTINNRTDSAWLKIEDIDELVREFLSPEIDSTNLTSLFTEKNFLDQTIAAFTFTYDPVSELPDSMKLKRWDVYIDAESSKVRRIYMIKEISKSKTLQLTWQSGKYFKITSILTDENGNSSVEKEEKITWDF
ncbi:MAG: hypothetical protein KTQ13_09870 [Ferruginibacter sp.]|nr:hypothetical protein [Ferruginibacter sp.]MBU9936948.1 hypothetical protein [Ferruginibacter sp.]